MPAADYDSGRVDEPYTCNTEVVSHVAGSGGFKVLRYVDDSGHECAYYDTQLLVGHDIVTQIQAQGAGVAVLDMSDPATPVQTDSLLSPAMLSPHESLDLHAGRGLLVAVMGTAATLPGIVDVYDIAEDCRHPTLKASSPVGLLGHESGFSPDGLTYYVSATGFSTIAAIDLTNPSLPVPVAYLNLTSHGMNVSADGNRLYTTPLDVGADVLPADSVAFDSGLAIVDVSQIQARQPLPSAPIVSELAYPDATIAQTAIPVTIDGTDYLVTIDEFVDFLDFLDPLSAAPGIGRLIDISDETDPRVVSTLELEVHQPDVRQRLSGDPGATLAAQSYAGHYCAVPSSVDPGIVACSFILSGLRIFDISDPTAPREIAYFNGGRGNPSPLNPQAAPYAMSAPAFAPDRCEIWYSDVASGFWAVRVTNDVWCPAAETPPVTTRLGPAAPDPVELPRTGTRLPMVAAFGAAALALAVVAMVRRRRLAE